MAIYEYKTRIRYTDINEQNMLSDKGLLTILSQAAGKHSDSIRLWFKSKARNTYCMDGFILEFTYI